MFEATSSNFPDEILIEIFKHLPPEELIATIPKVCKKWKRALEQPYLHPIILEPIPEELLEETQKKKEHTITQYNANIQKYEKKSPKRCCDIVLFLCGGVVLGCVGLGLEWDEVTRFDFKSLVWWMFTAPEAIGAIVGLIGLVGMIRGIVNYYANKTEQEQNLQQLTTQETNLVRFFKIFRPSLPSQDDAEKQANNSGVLIEDINDDYDSESSETQTLLLKAAE